MIKNKKIRLSMLDVYLGVICFFPIPTMLVDGGTVNKLMFAVLLVAQMGVLITRPIKKQKASLLVLLVIHWIYALTQTSFPMENMNLLFYYPFFVIYTIFMCDNSVRVLEWFKRNKKYVHLIIIIWSILVGVSAFLPSSYYLKEGGSSYFGSFSGSVFRLGQSAVFIQVLILISQTLYGYRKSIIYMLAPMYSFLMGSSRSYFVIGFFLFIISWYIFCKRKKMFWGTIIPLGLAAFAIMSMSAIADKIAYTLDNARYGDLLFRITSSRNLIWTECLNAWNSEGMIHKLLGAGIEFAIEATGHWAHNDFVEILCSFGIWGVIQYIWAMTDLRRECIRNTQIPLVIKWCSFFVWFFNANFNMHYVYFCAMLCYPFLMFLLKWYFTKNPVELNRKDEKTKALNSFYPYL